MKSNADFEKLDRLLGQLRTPANLPKLSFNPDAETTRPVDWFHAALALAAGVACLALCVGLAMRFGFRSHQPLEDPSSVMPPVSSWVSSEESPVSTEPSLPDSSAPSSVAEESSQPEPVTSKEPVSEAVDVSSEESVPYSYSSKAYQINEIDPANPPTIIWVQFTAEASDKNKKYSEEDFPGCDVSVIKQGYYGGNTFLYPEMTPDPNNPVLVYLELKINQPGFENYEKAIQYLDQREDIAVIGQTAFVIPD